MQNLWPILQTVRDHDDVRYYLSGLGQPPLDTAHNNRSATHFDPLEDEQSGMFHICFCRDFPFPFSMDRVMCIYTLFTN